MLHLARSTLPVIFALAAVSSAAGSVTFEMRPVAVLPFRPSVTIPCGDADRDRKPELYLQQGLEQIYAFEHLGGYRFDTIPLPLPHLLLWAIGDADRDGHMELVTQGEYCIVVYESPDSFSLPDSLVWADTIVASTYMHAVIVDLDADSAREIACLVYNEFSVYVLENTGDNRFELTTRVHEPNRPPTRFCQTFDMDLDGRPEFALGSDNGWVCFYEAVCNDSLRRIAACRLADSWRQLRGLKAAPDMDLDGRPELVAYAVDPGYEATLAVFESPCNDSFEVVWSCSLPCGTWGGEVAVGDVDGDGRLEFVVADGYATRLYRCIGDDRYEEAWQSPQYLDPVALYDINSDGRDELIVRSGRDETTVLAYWDTTSIAEADPPLLSRHTGPTVVRAGPIVLRGFPAGTTLEVLDIAGRAVDNDARLSPGAYFVRVRSGSQAVVQKVLVLR